jgi:hypothetical protein
MWGSHMMTLKGMLILENGFMFRLRSKKINTTIFTLMAPYMYIIQRKIFGQKDLNSEFPTKNSLRLSDYIGMVRIKVIMRIYQPKS